MKFNIKRRLLTTDEKIRRAIFFYTFNMNNFKIEYINGKYEEDEYHQPLVDIEKNLNKLDEKTKGLIYEFSNKQIYDETKNCYGEEWWNKNYPELELKEEITA